MPRYLRISGHFLQNFPTTLFEDLLRREFQQCRHIHLRIFVQEILNKSISDCIACTPGDSGICASKHIGFIVHIGALRKLRVFRMPERADFILRQAEKPLWAKLWIQRTCKAVRFSVNQQRGQKICICLFRMQYNGNTPMRCDDIRVRIHK